MKRVGYPEDSTQSAYSSQLIRIPLSAIIFYLSRFISREATTRQCWGGDQNQLLVVVVVVGRGEVFGGRGWGGSGDAHKHTPPLPHLQTDAVCIRLDDDESFRGRPSVPLLIPTSSARFVSFCLGRRRRVSSTRRVKEPIVWRGSRADRGSNRLLVRLALSIPRRKKEGGKAKC